MERFAAVFDWSTDQGNDPAAAGYNAVFTPPPSPEQYRRLHTQGLRVFVEFPVFHGCELWQRYPQARPIAADGGELTPSDWYFGLNPSVPGLRADRLAALTEIVSDGNIDGVWLDFIRWPGRWDTPEPALVETSFDRATLERFLAAIGQPDRVEPTRDALIAHSLLAEWHAWKRKAITDFVAEARRIVDRQATPPELGVFTVPWLPEEHDNALEQIVCQDICAIAAYADVVSPMLYPGICVKDIGWAVRTLAAIRTLVPAGTEVVPVIESPGIAGVSTDEFSWLYERLVGEPDSPSIIVFKAPEALRYPLPAGRHR